MRGIDGDDAFEHAVDDGTEAIAVIGEEGGASSEEFGHAVEFDADFLSAFVGGGFEFGGIVSGGDFLEGIGEIFEDGGNESRGEDRTDDQGGETGEEKETGPGSGGLRRETGDRGDEENRAERGENHRKPEDFEELPDETAA